MTDGTLGTPLTPGATRVMLLGAGELGKEVAIELQRLGVEVVAVDRYADAPAMQLAHRSHVVDMLDPDALRAVIALESPDLVIPEIEAIATAVLAEVEAAGTRVIPTARATQLTMDRAGAGPCDLAVPLRRFPRGARGRCGGGRAALRRQAGDVILGQGPVGAAQRGRGGRGLGLRPGRWPHRQRAPRRR